MAKLKVVTDSSCTMEPTVRDQLNIHVVPLSVMIDGMVYPDDDSLPGERFMQMMAQAKELPKTSQPPIGHFVELFDELGKDGSDVLSIHMTKGLSGTVEAARQASNLSKANVTVIDSDTTDQALSFQVIRAAQLAQEDKTLAEVLPEVDKVRENTKLFIGVSTLENLVKGGRISRAKGLLSSLLNMKVIMDFDHSELIPIVKGRGVKTFNKWFEELKDELKRMPNVKQIGISHAEGLEITEQFKKELQQLFPEMNIPLLHTTPIIATHTGKGAFAITYYTE
ncbi:DegV family protein [Enterococcus gallinarum]|uniref:DegV family protein n=1 Tax=Enterococcus gallinarum TaxID=1353 RepID=UPI001897196D|nr:DegV family protein [Enterococcus gallinarum]